MVSIIAMYPTSSVEIQILIGKSIMSCTNLNQNQKSCSHENDTKSTITSFHDKKIKILKWLISLNNSMSMPIGMEFRTHI